MGSSRLEYQDAGRRRESSKHRVEKRKRSLSPASTNDHNTRRSVHKKRRRHSSSSSSCTSSSSSDSDSKRRKRKKVAKAERKKRKRLRKKKKKKRSRKEVQALKATTATVGESTADTKLTDMKAPKEKMIGPDPKMMQRHSMKPMSKEEWEKKQSVLRHVYDPASGRTRLIKGDGEVMEEIVTYEQHLEINKKATEGDGATFQAKMGLQKKALFDRSKMISSKKPTKT